MCWRIILKEIEVCTQVTTFLRKLMYTRFKWILDIYSVVIMPYIYLALDFRSTLMHIAHLGYFFLVDWSSQPLHFHRWRKPSYVPQGLNFRSWKWDGRWKSKNWLPIFFIKVFFFFRQFNGGNQEQIFSLNNYYISIFWHLPVALGGVEKTLIRFAWGTVIWRRRWYKGKPIRTSRFLFFFF